MEPHSDTTKVQDALAKRWNLTTEADERSTATLQELQEYPPSSDYSLQVRRISYILL